MTRSAPAETVGPGIEELASLITGVRAALPGVELAGARDERRGTPAGHEARAEPVPRGTAVLWFAAYWANGRVWDLVFYDVLGMTPEDRLTSTLHFFFYDTIKIGLLLSGIIFVITILRSYMSIERTRALLGGRREGVGNVMAAGLGVATPFCSCSAVPAFIGFVAAGVPLGVTLSFLIASPLVNEIAVGLLLTLFGVQVTLAYVGAGLALAIGAGWVLGRLRLERYVEPFVYETTLGGQVIDSTAGLTFAQRVQMGSEEVANILRKIWPYLLVGIGLGAVIHGWAPESFFARVRRPGQCLRRAHRRPDRDPALLQRCWHPAARRSALRQGPTHGHAAGVHDGGGRPLPARDDPAPPGPQAPASRDLRGCRRRIDRRRRLPVQLPARLSLDERKRS